MTHTPNYQLSQRMESDRIQRIDFNDDNTKIDAALADLKSSKAEKSVLNALSAAVAGNTAALAGKGNCQVRKIEYTGNGLYGSDNPTTWTFENCTPLLVTVANAPSNTILRMINGITNTQLTGSGAWATVNWSGNSVSWYGATASVQMNASGATYVMVAILLQN